MSRIIRFSYEEKIKIVKDYLANRKGASEILATTGIGETTLYDWLRKYKTFGADGLSRSSKNQKYTAAFKLNIVTEYLSTGTSYEALCVKYKISDTRVVRDWVKQYNSHDNFQFSDTGDKIYMVKNRKTTFEERAEIVRFCIENGKNYRLTVTQFNVSYSQVYRWVKSYLELGSDGLLDNRGRKKPISNLSEMEKLKAENQALLIKLRRAEIENELLKKLNEIERGRD